MKRNLATTVNYKISQTLESNNNYVFLALPCGVLIIDNIFFKRRKFRSSHRKCSIKKVLLKISQQILFFNKVTFIKKENQVFFFEFCKMFKNTFFTEHLWVNASENGSFNIHCDSFKKFPTSTISIKVTCISLFHAEPGTGCSCNLIKIVIGNCCQNLFKPKNNQHSPTKILKQF